MTATANWEAGSWSPYRKYPSVPRFHEGRLVWAGKGEYWCSISDAYDSFDDGVEGDSGPINRTIGSGPVDTISWVLSMQRLVTGTEGRELSVYASSLDEILTPSNFNIKKFSTQGSKAGVDAVEIDDIGIFVGKGGTRIFQVAYDGGALKYKTADLTQYVPDIGEPSIVKLGVQRQPDTRVHCVRSDGKVAVYVAEPLEEVSCWLLLETDGVVEDVLVMPGDFVDQGYYVVYRTIQGQTKRYLERWALESQAQGGATNYIADSFINITNTPASTSVTGLDHLDGKEVIVWADSKNAGTYTVSGGAITLATAASAITVGLGYEAKFLSNKLGNVVGRKKRIRDLGLILADTHYQGLEFGQDFVHMDNLPLVEDGKTTDADTIWTEFDNDRMIIPGTYDEDTRIALKATAPKPCTILGVVMDVS